MYKECFKLMDMDKDGTINKSDLRAAFDNVGKLMDESELDDMLSEVGGACTFDGMIKMFQEKMAGGKLQYFANSPGDTANKKLSFAMMKGRDTNIASLTRSYLDDACVCDISTGSNDPDDLIIRAFRAYEGEGEEARKINAQMFTHALKTWGDKFTQAEVDDIFGEFEVDDDGFIAAKVRMCFVLNAQWKQFHIALS